MTKQRFTPAYPAELRERGVRLFRENRAGYASDTAAYKAIAPKLGCSPDSLRVWCQQAERDAGRRGGLTSAEKDRIKELEREVRELRQANEILKKAILNTLGDQPYLATEAVEACEHLRDALRKCDA